MTPDPRMVSSRHPGVLEFLRSCGLHDTTIAQVTEYAPTWSALTNLPVTDWVRIAGAQSARLVLPGPPPQPALLPSGITRVSRYDDHYPHRLWDLRHPPLLLYYRGQLPRLAVAVVAGNYPSPRALEVVADASRAAAAAGAAVIARSGSPAAAVAATVTAEMGTALVLVQAAGLETFHVDESEHEQAVARGGAVISTVAPTAPATPASDGDAEALVPALATVVVVAAAGLTDDYGVRAVTSAIAADRPIVVPAPAAGTYGPAPTEIATHMLASTHSFPTDVLGSNASVGKRLAAGMPAATAVVASAAELAAALRAELS